MNLFDINAQRQLILSQVAEADGELSDELAEELAISDDRIQEGALKLLGLLSTIQSNIIGAKADIEQRQAFIKSNEAIAERLKQTLKAAVIRFGPISAGTYRLATTPSKGVLLASDAIIPNEYCRHVPAVAESWVPDKKLIQKAIENGQSFDGATLEQRVNLAIK